MKKTMSIILSLMLLFCLTACNGSKEANNTSTNNPNPSQNTNQTGDSNVSEYSGTYESSDGYLIIYDDATFEMTDYDGSVYNSGTCSFKDGLALISEVGETLFLVPDGDGNLYGGEDTGTFFRVAIDSYPGEDIPNNNTPDNDIPDNDVPDNDAPDYNIPDRHPYSAFNKSDFQGCWQDSNNYIIQIIDDEWYLYDDGGRMVQSGPAEFEDSKAWLMNKDGSSGGGYLYFDEDGYLILSGEALTQLDQFPYGNSEN